MSELFNFGKTFRLCCQVVVLCAVVSVVSASACEISDGMLQKWNLQPTGFMAYSSIGPQTAIAMRDGAWPVVFSEDSTHMLQAYSLYPVKNQITNTNWFQIGKNLITDPGQGMLSAATSSDGRVGAVLMMVNSPYSAAVVGGTPGGFGGAMTGVQAIDFDKNGNLITGTLNTLPNIPGIFRGALLDISVSRTGDLGAIDANFNYYQNSPLLGGWGAIDLKQIFKPIPLPIPQTMDLALDSIGRPHIIGSSSIGEIVAYDFDIIQGKWTSETLSTQLSGQPLGATIVADSKGGVGAAWVNYTQPTGTQLIYAYKNGNEDWINTVVATNTVLNPITSAYEPIMSSQGVGLTYDADDNPVISFTANGKIWVAYDPVVAVPEPSTMLLLAAGGIFILVFRKRLR